MERSTITLQSRDCHRVACLPNWPVILSLNESKFAIGFSDGEVKIMPVPPADTAEKSVLTALHSKTYRCESLPSFEEVMSRLLRPCQIQGDPQGFYCPEVRHGRLDRFTLTSVRIGDPVDITVAVNKCLNMLQIPLEGTFSARTYSNRGGDYRKGAAAQLVDGAAPLIMHFGRNCRQLIIRLDDDALIALGEQVGTPVDSLTRHDTVRLDTPAGEALQRYARYVLSEIEQDSPALENPRLTRQMEEMLFMLILNAVEHGQAGTIPTPRAEGTPFYVKRAEHFMLDNLQNDITLDDIIVASTVSLRTLYRGFERCKGMTPMQMLKSLRLDRAHAELKTAKQGAKVTEIACKWGFTHLGNFAAEYRARYGGSPSETLRQSA
jgi:AraC-like DNA-binding protein